MKQTTTTILLFIALCIGIASCKEKGNNPEPQPDPTPTTVKNELPLLKFDFGEENPLKDPDVMKHEAEIGRAATDDVKYDGGHPGFVNKDLKTIPVAIYGLYIATEPSVVALCKEKVTKASECPLLKAMLEEKGFTVTFESVNGQPALVAVNKANDLKAVGTNNENSTYGTQSVLVISSETEDTSGINTTAKDFPSYSAFLSKSVDEIKDYEQKLGLRLFDEGSSEVDKVNLVFITKEDPAILSKTNISLIKYFTEPKNGIPYIVGICRVYIPELEYAKGKGIKAWFASNGYEKDFQVGHLMSGAHCAIAYDSEHRVQAMVFTQEDKTFIQLVIPQGKSSAPLASSLTPEVAESLRLALHSR